MTPVKAIDHIDGCSKPGFRYAATIHTNAATLKDGQAGKVVMICKNPKCHAKNIV